MAFDPDAYLSGGTTTDTFDPDAYLASSSDIPTLEPQVVSPPSFVERIKELAKTPSPEWMRPAEEWARTPLLHQMSREEATKSLGYDPGPLPEEYLPEGPAKDVVGGLREAGGEFVQSLSSPAMLAITLASGGSAAGGRIAAGAFAAQMASQTPELWQQFNDAQTLRDKTKIASQAALTIGGAALGARHAFKLGPEIPSGAGPEVTPSEAPPVQPPPEVPPTVSMGPTTIAQDVSRALQRPEFERRFTLQEPPPEAPPEIAPSVPIEQQLPNIPEPLPFNPEAGPAPQPESPMPVRTEFTRLPGAPEPQLSPAQRNGQILERRKGILDRKKELEARAANGEQGLEPLQAAVDAELLDPANPVVHAPPPEKVQPGEFAKPGYTALPTEPAAAPEPYTPEAAAARAAQPQPTTEPVGGNVAGFEKVYGPGEIPAGETISPEDAWDAAHSRATTGKAKPYGFVDRARTGAITPEEMGDLIYEHHRLVERAAGLEGMPEYAEASQAAKDFASNVLKPAETAWHQKGMVMQIERPVNLNTFTGMDQLMQAELGRGIKPSEAPKFTRMAEDVKNGESEVAKAVERSDARVRTKYAKVRDIPIEEAVARVKQMLKDCM